MWKTLGVTPAAAGAVVITVIAIYLVFMILIRALGQRSVARLATFDVLVVLIVGSAAGRVLTGNTPTLAAGVIALVALFALHAAALRLARTRFGGLLLRDRPVLLMAGPELLRSNMHRARVSEDEVWATLRRAGIRNRSEVACLTLEAAGAMSVLKRGVPLDRRMFAEVEGAAALPEDLFTPSI